MRRTKMDPRMIVLLIMALVAAACGSTVPQAQQSTDITNNELGNLSTGSVLPEGAHVNKKGQVVNKQGEVIGTAEEFGLTSSGSSLATGSGTTGATGTNGSAGSTGSAGGTTSGAFGPGITDSKIYLAVAQIDAGPANEAAVGQSLSADARKAYNAVIEEVNKAGGILGREVEPLYYRFEAASSETIDQQAQAACAHWTQDNEVFAFLWSDANGVLQECAKRASAIVPLPDSFYAALPEDFERYPSFYEISGLDIVRAGNVTVTGLHRQGYFGGEAKLGIVLWDTPEYKEAFDRGYLPALEQKGISPATDPAYVTPPQTFQDLGSTGADINNAVLRFQSQGITHVMLLDGPAGLCGGACMGTLFMRRAEQQNYRPRYGFNSNNAAIEGQSQGLYPPEQLPRSIAVEWADWDESYDEGWKLNQAREACYELMRKHAVPLTNVNERLVALAACEQLWFILAVVDRMNGAALNAPNFTAGVNAIGSSFQAPSAYAVHLSATQHDGVAAARNMKFVESCNCYKWSSDPYRV